MSGKSLGESIGFVGVIVSLAFVGLQIRQSNAQAQATAYQEIGIALSEHHRWHDDRLNRLETESRFPEAVRRWSLSDWEAVRRKMKSDLRLFEAALLQVDQGVLGQEAMSSLGLGGFRGLLRVSAWACLWDDPFWRVSGDVGASARAFVEEGTSVSERAACEVDLAALREAEGLVGTGAG